MSKKIITHNNGIVETRETFYTEKTIQQLKQQLAEKDKEIAHLKEKDNYHLRYELAGADETITNLKQQLEEKDKEIEKLKVFEKAYYFNQLQASQEDIQQFQQLANQSAVNINYIAIQELEKVKDFILENTMLETETAAVLTYIYQQIKELKGEKVCGLH